MAEPIDTTVPAAAEAGAKNPAPKAPLPRRIPTPPAKTSIFSPMLIGFVLLAVVMVGGLLFISQRVVGGATDQLANAGPGLQAEFIDQHNNYGIRPPVGWKIRDPHDRKNIYITGPNAADFPPFMVGYLEIKAGGIASYLQEWKGRIQFENKSVQFISEEPDSIDGCTATMRLIYELDHDLGVKDENSGKMVPGGKIVRVRVLQYIMESKPRFYSVSCQARADQFDKLLPYFEASARTFRRTKVPKLLPVPLND